jgi:hypothetical protein
MVITEHTKRNVTDSRFIFKLSTLVTMNKQFTGKTNGEVYITLVTIR